MRIVLLGPPGAGKGTQAKLMQERIGIAHIATGDLLRAAVSERTELGRAAQAYMVRGDLVPDALVISMIDQHLQVNGIAQSFLLDGFPRNVAQAEALEQLLAGDRGGLDHVVSLDVGREELIRRLSGRRTCPQCGAMYHVQFDPPATAGVCDRCCGTLVQRDDDREDTIRARLDVYDRATAPLIAFYRVRGLLRAVDGTGSAAQVMDRVLVQVNACH
jgi:adenylate kinase